MPRGGRFVRVRDFETGREQTIVSNRIHPFYVANRDIRPLRLLATAGGAPGGPSAAGARQNAPASGASGAGESLFAGPYSAPRPGTNAAGAWIEAQHLAPGHELFDDDGTFSEVIAVAIAPEPLEAYNLTVEDFHTFFVQGADGDDAPAVWTHNACFFNLNRLPADLRADVSDTLAHINAGTRPDGVPRNRWGHEYRNDDGALPTKTGGGDSIAYKSYDVPAQAGDAGVGPNRIIVGSDGSRFFTGTHYETFARIK